jgi:hypothetical protein
VGFKARKPLKDLFVDTETVADVAGLKLRVLRAPHGSPPNGLWGYPASDPGPTLGTLMFLGVDMEELNRS